MKKQQQRAKPDGASRNYGRCTAQRCASQAVGICPCGMALCADCLARHARFLGARYRRREQEDEQDGQEER